MNSDLDVLLINPNGRDRIYQEPGEALTAMGPPLWCRLIAGYIISKRYLDSVTQKFGWDTRAHVDQMTRHKLRREIVEDMEMSDTQPVT